jgi:hypothetical protein
MLPPWYGCAWYDFPRNEMVCYPVGLNLLVMMARAAYFAVKHGGHAVRINPRDAYAQGYADARKNGAQP